MNRGSTTIQVTADHRWFDQELKPIWIERDGFPDGSLAHPVAGGPLVLQTETDLSITDRQLDDAIAFGEFLAGHAFDDAERVEVRRVALDEFSHAPEGALTQLLAVRKAIRRIREISSIERSRLRTDALTRLRLAEHHAGVVSHVMSVVHRYNPTVLIVPERAIVITADTFDAWERWRTMIAAVVGLPPDMVWDRERELRELDSIVARWSDDEAEPLLRAHESWLSLRAGLRSGGPEKRRDLVETLRSEVKSPADVERVARALSHIVKVTDLVDAIARMGTAMAGRS